MATTTINDTPNPVVLFVLFICIRPFGCLYTVYSGTLPARRKIQLALHANNVRKMAVPVSASSRAIRSAQRSSYREKVDMKHGYLMRCMLGSSAHNTPQFEGNAKHSARVQIQSTHTKLSHTTYALWLNKMSIAVAGLF